MAYNFDPHARNGRFQHGQYGARHHAVNPVAAAAIKVIQAESQRCIQTLVEQASKQGIELSRQEAFEMYLDLAGLRPCKLN